MCLPKRRSVLKRLFVPIVSLLLILSLSLFAFSTNHEITVGEDGSYVCEDLKNNFGFVLTDPETDLPYAADTEAEGLLYSFDKNGTGSPYTGIHNEKYYVDGALYSGGAFELVSGGLLLSVGKTGSVKAVIKDSAKSGTYVKLVSGECYNVGYSDGKASPFTGVYKSKYYSKGKLYSGKAKTLVFDGYLYSVSGSGDAAKVVKDKSKSGSYQKIVSGKCYSVAYSTGKTAAYTGVFKDKYYEKSVLYSGKAKYIMFSGYAYSVSKNGSAKVYIKNASKDGNYQMIFGSSCKNVEYKTGKLSNFTGIYGGKYWKKSAVLKSDKAFKTYWNKFIYNVKKDGTAEKYIKNAKTKGTYTLVLDDKCYTVNNQTGAASLYTGFKTVDKVKYYFDKGVKASGWKTISKKDYYFKKGVAQENTIIGNNYVDSAGVKSTDPVIVLAVAFVNKHSKSSDSNDVRLKACFKYMSSHIHYKRVYGVPKAKDMAARAKTTFKSLSSNCYGFAASFAYIARVLGYDSGVMVGQVVSANGSWANHGWTLVKVDGKWLICDPVKQLQYKKKNLYLFPSNKAPLKYSKSGTKCYLTASDGKVAWK